MLKIVEASTGRWVQARSSVSGLSVDTNADLRWPIPKAMAKQVAARRHLARTRDDCLRKIKRFSKDGAAPEPTARA